MPGWKVGRLDVAVFRVATSKIDVATQNFHRWQSTVTQNGVMKYDSASQVRIIFFFFTEYRETKMLSELKSEVVNFAWFATEGRKRFHFVEALDLSIFYCALRSF